MDTSDMAANAKKYQKASTVCCSANVLLFLAYQYAILQEISPLRILREISRVARRTWRKFLEISSLPSSLTHTCPACLSILFHRRYPSAGKVYAVGERRLQILQENHRWVLLRGMFFSLDADQCAFWEEISFLRIFQELS